MNFHGIPIALAASADTVDARVATSLTCSIEVIAVAAS
jgi:hypothetical protein